MVDHAESMGRAMDIVIYRQQHEDVASDLYLQIREIRFNLRRRGPRQLPGHINALKKTARGYGFEVLADLCCGLEVALADNPGIAHVTAYLDRMADAVTCVDDDPGNASTLLASVSVHFVG